MDWNTIIPGSICILLLVVLWAMERSGMIHCALIGFGLIEDDTK